ncbi:hypothetical protein FG87_31950 [Nocardia vulneris]|uniref:Uncharacterized protein n=1 Tax=Nocardia vulneris TaxID=1141657 RepID=A0ABR4Z7B3_9NOCA|nr:hypothetical protein FG87_31950 [Nocardia vulneris]
MDVWVTAAVRGSFQVKYAEHIDKVCVAVRRFAEYGDMTMQLTLEQATTLRDLIDAGITDAIAAKVAAAVANTSEIDNDVDDTASINGDGTEADSTEAVSSYTQQLFDNTLTPDQPVPGPKGGAR